MTEAEWIENALEKSALKKTQFRQELLRALFQSKSPCSAAALMKKLSHHEFDRATLFRNLNRFTETGILSSTEFGLGSTFYFVPNEKGHQHHFFCRSCESAVAIHSCGASNLIQEMNKLGHRIDSHRLELFGVCEACRAN